VSGTFTERIDHLREQVGHGSITAHVVVDQVYAHYQHERMDLHHPRGGSAKYLEKSLMDHFRDYLSGYARQVLSNNGGTRAMEDAAEHLSDQVEVAAPKEWGDLCRSGHPSVTRDGATIYDRPPKVGRLSEQELRVKSRAILRQRLAEGLTVYFMRHGKVVVIPGRNEPHPPRGRL